MLKQFITSLKKHWKFNTKHERSKMLNQILKAMGHFPTAEKAGKVIYRTPFNPTEKTPSFFVFPNRKGEWKNFKDYSSGLGGDVHKFVMEYFNITFHEAKARITELTGIEIPENPTPFSFNQAEKTDTPSYKIISTQKITAKRSLLLYLNKRGISDKTIHKTNLYAITYEINEKTYYAIGFKNNSDGYEIRNAYFKGNLLNKDLTTISIGATGVKVFEGFIDYLSYLEMYPTTPRSDYIILNSVSLIEKALERLRVGYDLIELYLDNDKAGDDTVAKIRREVGSTKVIDKRSYYKEHKDLNEFLMNRSFK